MPSDGCEVFFTKLNNKLNSNLPLRVVVILTNSIKTLNASNIHYVSSKNALKSLSNYYAKNFANKIKRGTFIITDKKFAKNYTKSNLCEYNFMPFLVKHLNQLSQDKILSFKSFERFCNHKTVDNLSELFIIRQ